MHSSATLVQKKFIDPSVDNLVKGERGTNIFIPANTLLMPDGTKATGEVNVQLEEFLTAADFFSRNLSTVSGDRLLETGGMIRITATAAGRQLKIDPSAAIVIAMPVNEKTNGMETFYGDTIGGRVNWISTTDAAAYKLPAADSSIIDSSVFSKIITPCNILVGYKNVYTYWEMTIPDTDIFNYTEKNFERIDSTTRALICQRDQEGVRFDVKINLNGKVDDLIFEDKTPEAIKPGILQFFKEMPPFDVKKMGRGDNGDGILSAGLCCIHKLDPEKYKARFEQKYAAYKNKALKAMGKDELHYYMLTSKTLGWINCDRFYEDPSPKTDLYATVPSDIKNPSLMLMFDDIKSVMQADTSGGKWIFRNIPVGKKARLISVGERNRQAVMGVLPVSISNTPVHMSAFNPFTLNEFNTTINQ